MPLRPELRSQFYGAEWRAYRLRLIAIAQNRCAHCGAELPSPRLSGAHVTHDPRDMELVEVLCFACHARNDSGHRLAMMRRSRARRVGQLWLLPEIEWACFPAWLIPARVLRDAQGRLF
jgi:hypothetical protein